MGHIHSDSQYDYTASAIIVNKNKVALLFHHKLKLWLPPAGHVELDEPRSLFVLSCQYAARSISPEDYAALADDPEWELKHLLD